MINKISYDEYLKGKEDYELLLSYGDDYFSEMEDLLEYLDDEEYENISECYGVNKVRYKLNTGTIIDDYEYNAEIEDFELGNVATKKLDKLITKWNKKHGDYYYQENQGIIIIIDDKLKEECKGR